MPAPPPDPGEPAPDLDVIAELDRTIHAPARLMILAHLAVVDGADFNYLLRMTDLTRGNLSTHLSKLEAAGYVVITKQFVERVPRTLIRLSAEGQQALDRYREQMRQVVDQLLPPRRSRRD